MFKELSAYLQYFYPQHALTEVAGKFAESTSPTLKNLLIDRFISMYKVDMQSALISNPHDYATFNEFFTRKLKPELRPIAANPSIASPVDGCVVQVGTINDTQLLQAKSFYFDLNTLLGNEEAQAKQFIDGSFATFYLAPRDYHRVHMPYTGRLLQTIYIPGKLFSVNNNSANYIPRLFTRNERIICFFETELGPMTVILVGAMIVGSMQMVWQKTALRSDHIITQQFAEQSLNFNKGEELGMFKLGSTVIVLFSKDKVVWSTNLKPNSHVNFGSEIGIASASLNKNSIK